MTDFPPMYPGGNRIGAEEEEAAVRTLRSRRLFRYYGVSDGPSAVEAFETAFAERMTSRHALAVASGTTALTTALAAVGVGVGDQVIVPSYTWVSTAAAVLAVGAVPVLAEIDETLTIDVRDAASQVTPRTKAVIPVHMRGAAADMEAVQRMADRHGLTIIEDVAQALGGEHRGRPLGTLGDMGCFSLQFNKVITCGEGGIVVTGDDVLHERALMYHDVAASQRLEHPSSPAFYGLTCRMSELQGAVAGVQLSRLDAILADCRSNRERIADAIRDAATAQGIVFRASHDPAGDTGIALVLLCPDAERARSIAARGRAEGLPLKVLFEPHVTDLHVASHWQPILEKRSWAARTPWADRDADVAYGPERWRRTNDLLGRALHLDVSPDLSEAHVDAIGRTLGDAIARP